MSTSTKHFINSTSWIWVQFGARSTIWSLSSYPRKFYYRGLICMLYAICLWVTDIRKVWALWYLFLPLPFSLNFRCNYDDYVTLDLKKVNMISRHFPRTSKCIDLSENIPYINVIINLFQNVYIWCSFCVVWLKGEECKYILNRISGSCRHFEKMKERVSKLTYSTLNLESQCCIQRMANRIISGRHSELHKIILAKIQKGYKLFRKKIKSVFPVKMHIYTLCSS